MDNFNKQIAALLKAYNGEYAQKIERLPGSGSERVYFRAFCHVKTYIVAFNENVRENQAFYEMTNHFFEHNVPVPKLLSVSDDNKWYLLQDLGNLTLFNLLTAEKERNNLSSQLYQYYCDALKSLAHMQTVAAENMDYSVCYPVKAFDDTAIQWDLNYFKYYFAKLLGADFDELALETDFNALKQILLKAPSDFFMFRDFQSRNIMIYEDKAYFIDYQGGRKGALQYDVVSLLWQARAELSFDVRESLLNVYVNELKRYIEFNELDFRYYYDAFVLIRVLQTLGAYGFRGMYEQKAHFVLSLPKAVKNLELLVQTNRFIEKFPELNRLVNKLLSPKYQPWINQKTDESSFTVRVGSFSYKKGLPRDYTGNGGGHVFDCRAIHNPGRFQEYKQLTGKDQPVIEFLDGVDEMQAFLDAAKVIVSQSVETYLKRGFNHLSVYFGCTGGQHRSVYAADKIAKFVGNNYPVRLVIDHREQNF